MQDQYGGRVLNLIEKAANYEELERTLEEFKGIGPVRVNIFLRELREISPKADPPLQKFVILAARHLSLIETVNPREALEQLKQLWKENRVKEKSFAHLEIVLLRFGKDHCIEKKCDLTILEISAHNHNSSN